MGSHYTVRVLVFRIINTQATRYLKVKYIFNIPYDTG